MNLTTSSSDSGPSRNMSGTSSSESGPPLAPATSRPSRSKKESGKGGVTDLDLPLKLHAAKALSASGYYCKVNVSLSAVGGHGLSDVDRKSTRLNSSHLGISY